MLGEPRANGEDEKDRVRDEDLNVKSIFEDEEIRKAFLRTPEGRVFVVGSWGLIGWLALIFILWRVGSPRWNDLLVMGFTQLAVGRPGGIAFATSAGLPRAAITLMAIYVDMLTVSLAYPILIFFYKNLFGTPFFQRRLKRIFDSAERNLRRVSRFQILGLFFFVWSPFWMTGVVVGAVLGYLMGLRTWVTMGTVGAGTAASIFFWVYANEVVFGWVSKWPSWAPRTLALGMIGILILLRLFVVLRAKRRHHESTK